MEHMVIQALVFNQMIYSPASAKAWAERHSFAADDLVAVEKALVLKQFDPAEAPGARFVTVELEKGITAVGIPLTDKAVAPIAKSFSSNAHDFSAPSKPLAENKEVFNGEQYLNLPETPRSTVEPKVKPVEKFDSRFNIVKADARKQIVIGAVYVPYDPSDPTTIDTHGHIMTAEDIEKAAYRFLEEQKLYQVDQQHDHVPTYGHVVESYIAKAGDPLFKEGTWVMGVRVTDPEAWRKIEAGEITGFSLGGSAILDESVTA